MANPRKSKKRILIFSTLAVILIAPLVFAAKVAAPFIAVKDHILKQTVVPPESLQLHTELIYPLQRYETQGNEYIWADNDCSTFVSDYLLACGKPAFSRLTTLELIQDETMAWRGFIPTSHENIRPGDIIVYRYTGKKGDMVGHTGIVYTHKDEIHVVHNSAGTNGIATHPLDEFLADAKTRAKRLKIYTRSDYASWQKTFEARQTSNP